MVYEHKSKPLISRGKFARRIAIHVSIAFAILIPALGIGALGYRYFGSLTWIESLENAAMILGGMGQVSELYTDSARLFAAFYALFAGLVFILVFGIIAAPALHRLIHHIHLDDKNK